MLFYKIEGVINDNSIVENCDSRRATFEAARAISSRAEEFNSNNQRTYFFVSNFRDGRITAGAIGNIAGEIEDRIDKFCQSLAMDVKVVGFEEVTFKTLRNALSCASRNDLISDDDDILDRFDLGVLDGGRFGRCLQFGENITDALTKKDIMEITDRYLMEETVRPELDRIYAGKANSRAKGHPVHYMIMSDDHDTRNDMYRTLLSALYDNQRVEGKRYVYIDFRPGEDFSLKALDDVYKTTVGGSVVVRYKADDDEEDDYASGERDTIEKISEAIKRHKNDVLTILCLPRECTKAKDIFYENLGGMSFVELKEDMAKGDTAKGFLRFLAKKDHIRTDSNLFSKVDNNLSYLSNDLRVIYDDWYNAKLRSCVYPQYKDCKTARRKAAKKVAAGSAYDSLQDMIGLTSAKDVIQKALNYYKVQQMYKEQGISMNHPAMHMVFTGNPGTAKTTVARLFARIMKDNGLLSKGNLIEVGRGDLVGKYVGWTAQVVQKKFQEAKGSVLFIDEAYSLVDDRSGLFGDEAINTIVQEMENHRDELVVIFAGYPDKMEEFLNKNPGLRSRIAFHVPFEDYNADELCRIADLMGEQNKLHFTDEAKKKLHKIFDEVKDKESFGNGRYVRNLLEMAQMNQAGRILQMDADKVTKKDITTITDTDIEAPSIGDTKDKEKRPIGFCA